MTQSHLYHASRQELPANLTTAVSLHSHTSRSRETMSFIPRYVNNIPFVTAQINHLQAKYLEHHGTPFNYSRVWWTPPLEPKAAFDLERNQIERSLGRKALVSLSDHDCVDAGYALEIFAECAGAPISTEWTVPLGQSFLHLGVHNMQPARARMLHSAMAEVTAQPSYQSIYEMLDELQRDPHTLIVLNHPLWDEARFGNTVHLQMLTGFLDRHGHQIHALELNGLRPLAENLQIARLSKERRIPLVSGGDRHGCEPNAILNLTSAQSFNHFAAELRDGSPTHNVFMPQYDEPLRLRVLQLMSDVLRTYDSLDCNRRRWSDRIFYLCEDETIRRLSDVWSGNGPNLIGLFVTSMRLVESRRIRAVLRLALVDQLHSIGK